MSEHIKSDGVGGWYCEKHKVGITDNTNYHCEQCDGEQISDLRKRLEEADRQLKIEVRHRNKVINERDLAVDALRDIRLAPNILIADEIATDTLAKIRGE